ncbi:hypothetical protein DL771_000631 [Monosporascus sp. 5C6A]|nr:hypothetical protein DL771_000631 [Monosporascus sp. 5C6A]
MSGALPPPRPIAAAAVAEEPAPCECGKAFFRALSAPEQHRRNHPLHRDQAGPTMPKQKRRKKPEEYRRGRAYSPMRDPGYGFYAVNDTPPPGLWSEQAEMRYGIEDPGGAARSSDCDRCGACAHANWFPLPASGRGSRMWSLAAATDEMGMDGGCYGAGGSRATWLPLATKG